MNIERIKEIQGETAYPDSVSVHNALLQVWNECDQEKKSELNDLINWIDLKTMPYDETATTIIEKITYMIKQVKCQI